MNKFDRLNFFPLKNIFSNSQISKLLTNDIIYNKVTDSFKIQDISSLSYLRDNSLIFLNDELKDQFLENKKVHVITNKISNKKFYKNITVIKDINNAYNDIINKLFFHDDLTNFPDDFKFTKGSFISKYCKIHKTAEIGKNCTISRGVEIGCNTLIKNNVVVKNSLIGNDVTISDNSSIGTTGFGFDFNKRGSRDLNPQIGIVIIDNNVHIGSSCTIDRGKIDFTYIGKNSMIDNLVHIAHNVNIGNNACIAAQTGISGSVSIGNNVTVGGQVGFAGHINIGDNVVIAAKSGVTKNIKKNSVVAGFPAVDIKVWKKIIIRQRKNGH